MSVDIDNEQQAKNIFFEMLREKDVSLDSKNIDGQIRDLTLLSDCLHEITRLDGTVGYRAFHNAMRIAESVDYAIGNLKRIKELCGVLKDFNSVVRD